MGRMKKLWVNLFSEREFEALEKLKDVASTTEHPWLRDYALRKANQLERRAWDRVRPDVELAQELRDPHATDFGRFG